jgi:two-component system response regulator DegU
MNKTTVVVADDHPLLRDSIVHLLEKESDFEVVGQAADGEEAVKLVSERSPNVIVMDIEMPKMDGLDATRQIKSLYPDTSVLILTVHDDEEYVAAVLDAGATGYLLKTTYGKELVQAIRAAHYGEFVLDDQIGPKVFRAFTLRSNRVTSLSIKGRLTDRELEVMKLVARGKTNEEIVRLLGISLGSVKQLLSNTFLKLGVNSRVEATTTSICSGIISLSDVS